MLINEELENYILDKFNVMVEQQEEAAPRPDKMSVHVSDLVGCPLRSWHRVHEKFVVELTPMQKRTFWFGHVLHDKIILSDENELYMQANIEDMEIDLSDSKARLVGSLDNIIELPDGEKVICDTKTTFKIPKDGIPEAYVRQLSLYKLLYFIETKVEVKRGAILWCEKMTGLKNVKAEVVDLPEIAEIQDWAVQRMKLLHQDKAPPAEPYKWCKYCEHYNLNCFPDDL